MGFRVQGLGLKTFGCTGTVTKCAHGVSCRHSQGNENNVWYNNIKNGTGKTLVNVLIHKCAARKSEAGPDASTRWSTTLSSKGNLLHATNVKALSGTNLVTQRSKIRTNETLEHHPEDTVALRRPGPCTWQGLSFIRGPETAL